MISSHWIRVKKIKRENWDLHSGLWHVNTTLSTLAKAPEELSTHAVWPHIRIALKTKQNTKHEIIKTRDHGERWIKNILVHTSDIYLTVFRKAQNDHFQRWPRRWRLDFFISRETLRLALNRRPCALGHSRRTTKRPKFGSLYIYKKKNEYKPQGFPISDCQEPDPRLRGTD